LCAVAGHVARSLLAGVGMVVAFWAVGAVSQAHADVFSPRPSASQQAKAALRAPHPLSGVRIGPSHREERRVRKTVPRATRPGTVRRTARTAAGRLRPVRLAHRTGLPPVAEVPKDAGLPAVVEDVAAGGDPAGRQDDQGCHPPPTDPPPPIHRVAPHVAKAAPAVRGHPHRPAATGAHQAPPSPHLKPTGTITHAPRPRAERMALAAPVPAPVSGSGESDCSGGKTSSGTGDVSRISLPVSGLWSIAPQPAMRASRNIADKPSFSPD
jgi:hypothetical protein